MRIAIFSPFKSPNYGTVLQAFALAHVLQGMGHRCEYIQWKNFGKSILERVFFLLKRPLFYSRMKRQEALLSKDLTYEFMKREPYSATVEKNNAFCQKFIPFDENVYTLEELPRLERVHDMFLVGSDQTWSPNMLYRYSPHFLSFVRDKRKKAAYACSMGRTNLPEDFKRFLRKRLASFTHLSCREKTNTEMLRRLLNKEVTCVLDPTLLLSASQWETYMKEVAHMPSDYVLCYILGEKLAISQYAEHLGKKKGLPVYYILTRPMYEDRPNLLKGVDAPEFLWLVKNARYLVTDSFHGTIFSINFRTNFISFDKHNPDITLDNGRLMEILTDFGLQSHLHKDDDLSIPNDIDFTAVAPYLEKRRAESMDYLKGIFQS